MFQKRMKTMWLWAAIIFTCDWAIGQNKIVGYQYWFDNQSGSAQTVSVKSATVAKIKGSIPTGNLSSGYHLVTLRFQDSNGGYSNPTTAAFNISGGNIVGYEYWFDNQQASAVEVAVPGSTVADISANISTGTLTKGYHSITIRFKDQTGFYSAPQTFLFIVANANIIAYEYWFDFDYSSKVTSSVTPTQNLDLSASIDASKLTTGTHYLLMHFEDALGNWSSNTIDTLSIVSAIAPVSVLTDLTLSPSLTSGNVRLTGSLKNPGNVIATVYNNLGMVMAVTNLEAGGPFTHQFDFASLPSGTYYMRIQQSNDYIIKKFVKQ